MKTNNRKIAVLSHNVKEITFMQVGLQFSSVNHDYQKVSAQVLSLLEKTTTPDFIKVSQFNSSHNKINIVFLLYYLNNSGENQIFSYVEEFITQCDKDIGCWHETIKVPVERIETHSSSPKEVVNDSGVYNLAESLDESLIYGKWGSMRKRMPILKNHYEEHHNHFNEMSNHSACSVSNISITEDITDLCFIRSGQNWNSADNDEIQFYQSNLGQKLITGVLGLQNQKSGTKCKCARLLYDIDPEILRSKAQIELLKSSSVFAGFVSFKDLEIWARSHPEHLAIWSTFVSQRDLLPNLGIWHEVYLVPQNMFTAKYVNCNLDTNFWASA